MKTVSESELLNEIHAKIVESVLDKLILMRLTKGPVSNNDIVKFVPDRFHVSINSEKITSSLYFLENKGFIKSTKSEKGKIYNLTPKGEERVKLFLKLKEKILGLVLDLFVS